MGHDSQPRGARVEGFIREILSRALKVEAGEFDSDAPYRDFGVDSILAVEIIHELNAGLGTQLQATDLFSHASIARLVQHLETLLPQEMKLPGETSVDATPDAGGGAPREWRLAGAPAEKASAGFSGDGPGAEAPPRSSGTPAEANAADEPAGAASGGLREIAIIGMAGQFPGARNLEEFWENLRRGRNSIQEVDALRWDPKLHFAAGPNQPNKTSSKWGGWLEGIDLFDPLFFNISPREAQCMDPKQRLFLQAAWSALEDAGQVEAPGGRRCGVFVGCSPGDYKSKLQEHGVPANTYTLVANAESILAARISYFLNLQGPAVTVDTACSSSLMAVNLACESLLSGVCDLAVAGGVCVLTTPEFHIQASQAGMLSPGGQCRTFDQRADGFVPAEGVGAVVLKELQAALRDGDLIHAVINGYGANQDGRTNGITAPSAASQTRLELEVYERCGLNPEQVQYVEAHGSGTRLGDPIEVNALTEAFRKHTGRKQFCGIGSVKTNIGHCLAAAGMAGLIKVVLCLKHGQLAPSLHLETPNEHIPFADSPFFVVTQARAWPATEPGGRQAVVSSFGFSGTNVHLAVREPRPVLRAFAPDRLPVYPVIFSAKSEEALRERLRIFQVWMGRQETPPTLEQVSFSSLRGRGRFPVRQALVATDWATLRGRVDAVVNQSSPPEAWRGNTETDPVEMEPGKKAAAARFLENANGADPGLFRRGLAEACELWAGGHDLDLSRLFRNGAPRRISLPTYPFERKSFWIPGVRLPGAGSQAANGPPDPRHPLVHLRSPGATAGEQRFPSVFNGGEFFFREHQFHGKPILPGVAFIEMAREAGARASERALDGIRNMVWVAPLTHQGKELKVEVVVGPDPAPDSFVVKSFQEGREIVHAQGRLTYRTDEAGPPEPGKVDLEAVRRRCGNRLDGAECYARFRELHLELGPHFQTIQSLVFNESESLAELKLSCGDEGFQLHPGILDGALQSLLGLWGSGLETMRVPYSMEELKIFAPLPGHCHAHATAVAAGNNGGAGRGKFHLQVVGPDGQVFLGIRGFYPRAFQTAAAKPVAAGPARARGGFAAAEWVSAPFESVEPAPALPGACLLFDLNDALLTEFRNRSGPGGGAVFVAVRPGDRYRYLGNQAYEINPASRADHDRLLTALARQGLFPAFIAHFWSQDHERPAGEEDGAALSWPMVSFIHLCQALLNSPFKAGPALRLDYLFSTREAERKAGYAAMSGLIRCLNRESGSIQARQLELRPSTETMEPGQLAALVAGLTREWLEKPKLIRRPEILLENGRRFEKGWRAAALQPDAGAGRGLRRGATYLITGGMGGLGGLLAERLAREYGATLALLGRSPADDAIRDRAARLSLLGGAVRYYSCDLSNRSQTAETLAQIERECGAFNGIFHCAGVTADSYLARKTPEQFAAVFKPKIQGLRHLDALSAGHPLDFVCLFSSLAAALGNPGQADYALANAYLDRFAEQRESLRRNHQRAGVTLSINWPLWEQGGMSMELGPASFSPVKDLKPLTTEQGWQFVCAALASGLSGSWACHEDPVALVALLDPPVLEGADRVRPVVTVPSASSRAASTSGAETKAMLLSLLKQWVGEIMLLDPGAVLAKKELGAYGFDSMSFTRLAGKVNEQFHLEVSPALFFEFPTLDLVAQHLLEAHGLAGLSPATPLPPAAAAGQPALEQARAAVAGSRFGAPGRAEPEFIAVIGMSGVLPESPDLETFWRHLKEGRCLIREIPAERWNWREYDGDPTREENKTRVKFGGFMPGVENFDAGFFGISPREADLMDPQQRIFLQTAWHAVENAGYRASDLAGRNVAVFAGVCTSDYFELSKARGVRIEAHTSTGMAHSILTNRLSFLWDLRGPSEPVDTACSSSLIAVHRAVEALRTGRCEMAIAGGVNAILTPTLHISFGKAGMLAEDGKCKTFDDRADGYARGEGCGAVLLKPLSQAVADGDCIQAVIRSSQETHAGRANSLTAPNPRSQARLIAQAIQAAGVDPGTITYVEAHGTGTRLGDPIEIRGLTAAFEELSQKAGSPPRPNGYCGLGSVKTNVGHLEAAAGITGLLKVVLAMKHRQIPATLHFERLNPNIRLEGTPFYIAETTREWKPLQDADGHQIPRRAGLSSFGFGGANAHLVLEEAPAAVSSLLLPGPYLILLSAKTRERLKEVAGRLESFLQGRILPGEPAEPEFMTSLAYTLQTGREAMEARAACLAGTADELAGHLRSFLDGRSGPGWLEEAAADGEGAGPVGELCLNQRWEALGRLWARGVEIDWKMCYHSGFPVKLPLPGYPFAPERHWIPESKAIPVESGPGPHPLIDGMDARSSLGPGAAFSKCLRPEEPVCRDHRVRGSLIFPAVASLEMAVAAAERSVSLPDLQITQTFWLQPLVVEAGARDLTILFKPSDSGPDFLFEIGSRGPGPVQHSTGRVSAMGRPFSAQAAVVPQTFIQRASGSVSGASLYETLAARGYEYGPFFKGVQRVWLGGDEALGEIRVPPEMAGEARRYRLPPTILDGALQILSVFYREMPVPLLPFSVERVEIAGLCGQRCFAYVRREGEHRFYIEILDELDRVCVRLRDFCYREWSERREGLFYAARWVRQELGPGRMAGPAGQNGEDSAGALVIRCSLTGDLASNLRNHLGSSRSGGYLDLAPWLGAADSPARARELQEALDGVIRGGSKPRRVYWVWEPEPAPPGREATVAGLKDGYAALIWFYRLLKGILSHPSIPEGCRFHLLTRSSFPVLEEEPGCPVGAALWGLLRAVAPEHPGFEFRCLDLETAAAGRADAIEPMLESIHAEGAMGGQNQAGLRSGLRYARELGPVEVPKPAGAASAFRSGGLYVIIGWRGLGLVVGGHLQKRHQARVVLLGRSAWDESKRILFERAASGPSLRYIQADICDAAQCDAAFRRIGREEGVIHGVIHAAMDLQDQSFQRMEESRFLAALAAKSLGTLNVFAALRRDAPDFVLLFSSLQSWVANAGQSNYVAGCCFQDQAGRTLGARLPYPVKTINWSSWGGAGAVAGEEIQQKLRSAGLEPISPSEGLEAMEQIMASGLRHCYVIKARETFLRRHGIQSGQILRAPSARPSVFSALEQSSSDWNPRACLDFQAGLGRLEQLGRALLARRLRQSGCFDRPRPLRTLEDWCLHLRCVEPYPKWIPLLWGMLERQGLGSLEPDGFLLRAGEPAPPSHPESELDGLIQVVPALAPFARLLRECVRALPDILSGATPVTDVLFPNASMDLVSGIYQDNEFSDAFNRMARQSVLAYIGARLRQGGESIQVLEVGAGTGGATAALLAGLVPHTGRLTYCYTDISDSFLRHGKRLFGPSHPFVEFRPFNVERDAGSQGFSAGRFDVILASNVLHATRNIRATLRNLQPLLKAGGWLVLNEATCPQDFLSLTFGLTPGWWLFEDAGERRPHSPLLSVSQWKTVLLEEGFGRARAAGGEASEAPPADELRQHVIVAETAGPVAPGQRPDRVGALHPPVPAPEPAAGAGVGRTGVKPAHPGNGTGGSVGASPRDLEARRLIRGALQKVLQTARDDFDERQPFANFGVDSILAVEVIQQINLGLGIQLRTTDIFNFSSIEKLGERIREAFPAPAPKPSGDFSTVRGLRGPEAPPLSRSPLPAEAGRRGERGRARDPRRVFEQLEAGELSVEEAFSSLREETR